MALTTLRPQIRAWIEHDGHTTEVLVQSLDQSMDALNGHIEVSLRGIVPFRSAAATDGEPIAVSAEDLPDVVLRCPVCAHISNPHQCSGSA